MKKMILLLLWGILIATAITFWFQSDIALKDTPTMIQEWLKDFGVLNAALIYVFLYTIRPLIFFPATLLTVASGLIFGPWLGILFTIIGENFSANFAFFVARYLGRDWVETREFELLKSWDHKLRENGFVTVLIMRLIYLPFDAVHYFCGLSSMRQRDFALGTFIGILPGLTTFVLLGGSASAEVSGMLMIGQLDISHRTVVLGLSAFFFVFGLIIARVLKKRHAHV